MCESNERGRKQATQIFKVNLYLFPKPYFRNKARNAEMIMQSTTDREEYRVQRRPTPHGGVFPGSTVPIPTVSCGRRQLCRRSKCVFSETYGCKNHFDAYLIIYPFVVPFRLSGDSDVSGSVLQCTVKFNGSLPPHMGVYQQLLH